MPPFQAREASVITPAAVQPRCCHTDPKGIPSNIPSHGSDAPATAVTHSKHSCHSIASIQEDKTAEQFAKNSDIDQISTRELYETLRHFPELRRKNQMEQSGVNTSLREERNTSQKNKIYETR